MVMTDEERRKQFVVKLMAQRDSRRGLDLAIALRDHSAAIVNLRESAADEIERLAALAQSDVKPVAWQWRGKYANGEWTDWKVGIDGDFWDRQPSESYERRNLYAAPPRPDASAGLLDVGPRDIREALADIRALEVRLAEQKQFNELLADELKQARRAAQSDAEPIAGLIEAAEWHEQRAEEFRIEAEQADEPSPAPQVVTHLASAYEFRRRVARAADRSAK